MAVVQKVEASKKVLVNPPNMQVVGISIVGNAPFVMHKFSQKAKLDMMAAMGETKGKNTSKKGTVKDWDDDLIQAIHFSREGWIGIPASSFRKAAISACRIVNFKMTLAKLGIFVVADGYDRDEGSPLVKLNGEYHAVDHVVRLPTSGTSTVVRRPMFDEWDAKVRVKYDADMFSPSDLYNLFMRVGLQVGLGEGRPDSRESAGMGWGTFDIVEMEDYGRDS